MTEILFVVGVFVFCTLWSLIPLALALRCVQHFKREQDPLLALKPPIPFLDILDNKAARLKRKREIYEATIDRG